jgi:transcriptional regulator with XRE-family HTH domain
MTFGEYLKQLRNEKKISQRELAEMSGISNAEISRIETGERKKPSHLTLKAIAPFLGIAYEELLRQAGFIEEVIEHQGFTENIIRDDEGNLIDIARRTKVMYESDSKWANLAYRVSTSDLSEKELDIIKASTEVLLQNFLQSKKYQEK